MKAIEVTGKRRVKNVELPDPEVREDGIVIRLEACGVCGTDVHGYSTNKYLDTLTRRINGHDIIGHEFTGTVVEVGEEVSEFRAGDRVLSVHNKGGMAELIELHGEDLKDVYQVPESIDTRSAATVEPLAVSVHAYRLEEPSDDDTVVVFGAGVIGLGYLQVVKALTEATVIVVEVSKPRLEKARELGADHLIDAGSEDVLSRIKELTGEHPVRYHDETAGGCDIAIDCAGATHTAQQMLEALKPTGGTAIAIAFYGGTVPVDPTLINLKEITILGSQSYVDRDVREAIELLDRGAIDRNSLISHTYPLEQVDRAFATQANTDESVKVLLTAGEAEEG